MSEIKDLRITDKPATSNEYFDTISIMDSTNLKRNTNMIGKCDCYVDYNYYPNDLPRLVYDFDDVKYRQGIGFVIKKDRDEVIRVLHCIDYESCGFLTPAGHRNVQRDLVIKVFNEHYHQNQNKSQPAR